MKKYLSLLLAIILVTATSVGTVFADSNLEGMPDSLKNIVKDNYWAELEYKSKNAIPKYLMIPEKSSLDGISFSANDGSDYPSTGIRTDRLSLFPMLPRENNFDNTEMWTQIYTALAEDPSQANGQPEINMDVVKAFNFDFKKSFLDTNDLYVYGDISVNGNTQHDKVATLTRGQRVELKFSLDMSKMKKVLNTYLMAQSGSKNHSDPQTSWDTPSNSAWKKDHADSDAELVFVMDLPKGVKVDSDSKFTMEGLPGFDISHEIKGQRLIAHVRKAKGSTEKSLKKIYEKINKLDKVSLSISNLQITKETPVGENLKITGYAYGAYDLASGTNADVINTKDMSKKKADDIIYRGYWIFAAKQDNAGRDSTADANKPNLISYTFKVNKPAESTVTFVSEGKQYATAKVETGKSIDNDSLTDQSMPADPTKKGYTFKEWNTKEDGTGTAFTGKTVVSEDMTVYAIYNKDAQGEKDKPKDKPKDKKKGKLPKTGDEASLSLYLTLLGLAGLTGGAVLIRRRKEK